MGLILLADTSQTLLGQQNYIFFCFYADMESVFTHHEFMIYFRPEVATDVCCVEVLLHLVCILRLAASTRLLESPHQQSPTIISEFIEDGAM